jgi:nitroreductase
MIALTGNPLSQYDRQSSPLHELLAAATAAPSMHNTQPWRFTVSQDAIELRVDPERTL